MTGVESSGIDVTWLLANLEIASVPTSADDEAGGQIETLVLGPKAFHVAESYVLSLFQLYPNVYYHKTARAAEKVFADLMLRLVPLIRDGHGSKTGLPANHPICRFATEPSQPERVIALDDAVFWGALPFMVDAEHAIIADRARRLWYRNLPKCIDVRLTLEEEIPHQGQDRKAREERNARIQGRCKQIVAIVEEWSANRPEFAPPILLDQARRRPYTGFGDSGSLLNQILIRLSGNKCLDMADISPMVANAETFEVCRVYITDGDSESKTRVENIIRTTPEEGLRAIV